MKKICLLVLCVAILFVTTSCSSSHYAKDGQEIYCGFVLIRDIDNVSHICYDKSTNICYVIIDTEKVSGFGISPYYIIEHGEPVIAVYGKNYK